MRQVHTSKVQTASLSFWIAHFRGGLIAFFAAFVLGMVAIFVLTSRAQAFSSDLNALRNKYPFIANTRLDNCVFCHVSGSNNLNPYGQAYLASNRNFAAIEGLDSDGDGYNNLTEILALSFPGDSSDMPVPPTPTFTPFPPMTATATVPPTESPTPTAPLPTTEEPSATSLPTSTEVPTETLPAPSETPVVSPTPGEPTPTPTEVTPTPTEMTPTPVSTVLDLDIKKFEVSSRVKMEKKMRPIDIRVEIKNSSSVSGQGMLTVSGVQNGAEVYHQELSVSAPVGKGPARYFFPSFLPDAPGEIVWTATLSDEDPDMDQAVQKTMVSRVVEDGDGTGLDLDIHKFKAPSHIKFNKMKPIDIRLEVKNASMVSGRGEAVVVGVQNGVEVYNQTIPVFDAVGNGHVSYHLLSFLPSAPGEIIWTVTLSDGDPDADSITASTLVEP